MIKMMLLVKKRAGMSREAFVDYYDNRHVPFMHGLLEGGGAAIHRRNFVLPEGSDGDYDAITEVFYKDAAAIAAVTAKFADPEVVRAMRADEDNFIEPGSLRRFVVEVHETVFEAIDH